MSEYKMVSSDSHVNIPIEAWQTYLDPQFRELAHIGVDNIMWANDHPHSESTWPNSKSLTDEWFSEYGEEEKAKILWQNTARVHNIEI